MKFVNVTCPRRRSSLEMMSMSFDRGRFAVVHKARAVYRSGCHDKHNCQQWDSNLGPLTPHSDALTHWPLWLSRQTQLPAVRFKPGSSYTTFGCTNPLTTVTCCIRLYSLQTPMFQHIADAAVIDVLLQLARLFTSVQLWFCCAAVQQLTRFQVR